LSELENWEREGIPCTEEEAVAKKRHAANTVGEITPASLEELAAQVAEIAALSVQEEKRTLWRQLNALKPVRPMVMIDQVCWNEMNPYDELVLRCGDPECQRYEESLRRTLFQWKHFPADMVVEPFIRVPKAIHNSWFGIDIQERIAVTDPNNDVVAHRYVNQFQSMDDLEKAALAHKISKTSGV
jgi:hypothetical protein